ncbi:hypothetical protein FHE72_01215 [Rossellomorea vietnamensis]|uniref:Aminoacyl-tRNA synthetase class II (G/ P/ S/T) domain-containing protein n=1 Tax=Rossellomorea vietnamensis TaxID=218284 RepID=A0A6I6UML9_9BACI|nr:aminoacyl--tRNA ligase-related protein [Rossellomorea vietnamensis]QHE59813.1 hypothetical protein FHE72_01215 [Rossellomorea vietnamensis]
MKKILYNIPKSLNSIQKEEFIECVNFLTKKIVNIEYDDYSLILHLNDIPEHEIKELKESLANLLMEIKSKKIIKEKELKSNIEDIKPPSLYKEKDRFNNLFLTEEEIGLLDLLDKKLIDIAKKYNSTMRQYPGLLSEEVMNKSSYNHNFPQNIGMIFDIPHDYYNIEAYRESKDSNYAEYSGVYMQPCICYHCYDEWRNNIANKVITAKGACYRHEVPWKKNKFRKNEFQMREIVFIGTKNEVLTLREQFIQEVWSLFNTLGLKGKVVTANDPFFFNDNFKKGMYQKLTNSKYELLYKSKEHSYISIASFNFCDDVVCKSYGLMNLNHEYYYSGCVAFGLDRWLVSIMELDDYGLYKAKQHLQGES